MDLGIRVLEAARPGDLWRRGLCGAFLFGVLVFGLLFSFGDLAELTSSHAAFCFKRSDSDKVCVKPRFLCGFFALLGDGFGLGVPLDELGVKYAVAF